MRIIHWVPALVQAALIFLLSEQSSPPVDTEIPDYLLHGAAYLVLGAAIGWGISGGLRLPLNRLKLIATWLLGTGYGILDEFHQVFVPGRDPSLRDVAADAVGAAVGALAILAVSRVVLKLRP